MTLTPLPNFKTDPDYFYCQKLSAWLKRSKCVEYQDLAKHVDANNFYSGRPDVAYARKLSCLDCAEGREIKKTCCKIKPIRPTLKVVRSNNKPKVTKRVRVASNRVDWKDIMQGFNRKTGKQWTCVKQWLSHVYNNHDHNAKKTADFLGVSPSTLTTKLRQDHTPVKGRKDGVGTALFLAIPESEMAGMTKVDIATRTGLSIHMIARLIKVHNREYVMMGTWRGKKRCG